MKKFVRIIIAYVLTLCLLTVIVNLACENLGLNENPEVLKFSDMPEEITICNLGSSHGLYGFTYKELSLDSGFNFGLSSQMLSYDLRVLSYYQDHLAQNAVVFIPVSYFSFYGCIEIEQETFWDKNVRYYSILPASLIKEFDSKTAIMTQARVLTLGPAIIEEMIGAVQKRTMEKPDSRSPYWEQTTNAVAAGNDAVAAAKRHLLQDKLDAQGVRILNQEELDALYTIIDLCRARGAMPILVTTPFLREYNEEVQRIDSDFLTDFHAQIEEIQRATGVEYYDYSGDERFAGEYQLFINSDHLNREGAIQFMEILLDEVVKDRLEFVSLQHTP